MSAINFFKQKKGFKYSPEKRTTGFTLEDYFAEMEKKSLIPNVNGRGRNVSTAIPKYRTQLKSTDTQELQEYSGIQPIINPVNKKYLRPLKFIKGNKYESREIEKIREEQQDCNEKRPNSRNNKSTICSSLDNEGIKRIEHWSKQIDYTKFNEKLIRRVTNKW